MKKSQEQIASHYRERLLELYRRLKESRDPELPLLLAQIEEDLYWTLAERKRDKAEFLVH